MARAATCKGRFVWSSIASSSSGSIARAASGTIEVMRPRAKVKAALAICPHCREPARPEFASSVEEDSRLAAEPLSRVGIPPYDIVRIEGSTESGFFLLAADRQDCHLG